MTIPDTINGIFELVGSVLTWMNAWYLFKDKQVKGSFPPAFIFFAIWGIWNLYYYPSLDQILSFYGGLLLVAGNIMWVGLYIKFRVSKRKREKMLRKFPLTESECFDINNESKYVSSSDPYKNE